MNRRSSNRNFGKEGSAFGYIIDIIAFLVNFTTDRVGSGFADFLRRSAAALNGLEFPAVRWFFSVLFVFLPLDLLRRAGDDGSGVGRIQGRQDDVNCAPRHMPVLVPFATEAPSSVRSFAGRTYGSLRVEGFLRTEGLPLYHPHG